MLQLTQCCNNVATLYCTKNRCCKSSRVTSPKGTLQSRLSSLFGNNAKYTSLFSCYKNRETTSEWQNHSLCQTNMSHKHYVKRYKQMRRTFENFLLAVLLGAWARTSEKATRKVAAKQPAGAVKQPCRLFALTFVNKRVS